MPDALRRTDCTCTFGLINPPELKHDLISMVEERTRQYIDGQLKFCDCERGQRSQRFYAARAGNPYGAQLAEAARQRRTAYLEKLDGLKPHEREWTFNGYRVGRHNRAAFDAVQSAVQQGHGLITLWGVPGVGKTALLMTAINECRRQDWPAMYRTTADLLAWLRAGFDSQQRDNEDFSFDRRWRTLIEARCLAIDEMTAFSMTPWAIERFERLIDERWRTMRETITLCAFNAAEDAEGRTGLPDVVESRLRDRRAGWIGVGGMDMRRVRS